MAQISSDTEPKARLIGQIKQIVVDMAAVQKQNTQLKHQISHAQSEYSDIMSSNDQSEAESLMDSFLSEDDQKKPEPKPSFFQKIRGFFTSLFS